MERKTIELVGSKKTFFLPGRARICLCSGTFCRRPVDVIKNAIFFQQVEPVQGVGAVALLWWQQVVCGILEKSVCRRSRSSVIRRRQRRGTHALMTNLHQRVEGAAHTPRARRGALCIQDEGVSQTFLLSEQVRLEQSLRHTSQKPLSVSAHASKK